MSSEDQKHSSIEQEKLSRRNVLGSYIMPHRAIHHFSFPRTRLLEMMLLPLIFTLAAFPVLEILVAGWMALFEFWLDKLEITANVSMKLYELLGVEVMLPHLVVPTGIPEQETFQLVVVNTSIALLASLILPERMLPLKYIIRVLVFIQATALLYFAYLPGQFPYTLTSHLENMMIACVYLMLIVPWIHVVVYYIFDFSFLNKALLTFYTLLFLAVFLPFLLLMHTYLVVHFSLLVLPVLYFVFGLFLLIMTCIAFYGWAMSWKRLEY